jgi:hypothetical protein
MNSKGFAFPIILVGALVVGLVVYLVMTSLMGQKTSVSEVAQKASQVVSGTSGFDFNESTPGYENLEDLQQGCPFKDCIPSIDEPQFESVSSAEEWLESDDVVFVMELNAVVRAYPQIIMNRHEIVNDVIGDSPIVISFCPLCGSSLAFDRSIDGEVLEFGVSGKLHKNDLIMYDRQTESLWQQITGEAIVGEMFGTILKQIPLSGMRWSQFAEDFSNAEVLSREKSAATYETYPYGDYESDPNPLFPMNNLDDTIHPKTVVYGVELEGESKAYIEELVERDSLIIDEIDDVGVEISYDNGNVEVIRTDTGEQIPATRLFWFAWKAFNPETELYEGS